MRCNYLTLGNMVKRKICYGIVQPGQSVTDGIPVIKVNNLISGLKSLSELDTTTRENEAKYIRTRLHGGELIISVVGTIGKTAIVPKSFAGCNLVRATALIDIEDALLSKWVKYYIDSPYGQSYIEQNLNTTVQPTLNIKSLEKMSIPLYDAEYMKKIVILLSSLDEKIAINWAINDNLQQQAASIFAEWLNTCTDFSTIGDMAHNILDYSPVGSEQIRLLNSSDVTEGVFPIAPLVPNKDLKGHFKKRFKFGDILYSEIRPRNHHYGFVLFDASDYIASTRLMVIRAIENKVSPAMLYQYLLLPEVEAEFTLKTESRSGTFPQGNYADMASIQVPYSPTNSQTAVSEILSRIRFAIAQNQFESQRLAELRDTLLPKLMSGEIDVSAVQP